MAKKAPYKEITSPPPHIENKWLFTVIYYSFNNVVIIIKFAT